MISVRYGQGGRDALTAYDPTRQVYSGTEGVLALLAHSVVELVYERLYQPHTANFLVNKRYDRVRLPNGRYAMKPTGMWMKKMVYRDMTDRTAVPVDRLWRGAPKRRMLVTRDFAMLNSWGADTLKFRPPKHGKSHRKDLIVVWDLVWGDWRCIDTNDQISVATIIPTTMYPGVMSADLLHPPPIDDEGRRLIEVQKKVLFGILQANFQMTGNRRLNYLDNNVNLSLQFQEESLRKRLFDEHEQHLKELAERRRKDAERRERQRLEKERLEKQRQEQLAQQQQKEQEAQRLAQQKKEQAALQQQQQQQKQQQQQLPTKGGGLAEKDAARDANQRTNLERPGGVEIKDGSARPSDQTTQRTGHPENQSSPKNVMDGDRNAIPENGIVGQNNEKKKREQNGA